MPFIGPRGFPRDSACSRCKLRPSVTPPGLRNVYLIYPMNFPHLRFVSRLAAAGLACSAPILPCATAAGTLKVSSNVVGASAGEAHSMFPRTDGTLWAMGRNAFGQLGDGTLTTGTTPVQISTGMSSFAAGQNHSLFVRVADGSLWATGLNASGQLGDGFFNVRTTPVRVVTSGVASVSAGGAGPRCHRHFGICRWWHPAQLDG